MVVEITRWPARAAAWTLVLLLAACATTPEQEPARNTRVVQPRGTMTIEMNPQDGSASSAAGSAEDRARIYKGSGVVVKGQTAGGTAATPAKPAPSPAGSGVVLNFEGADLREVVRNVLGDILNESYTIDPSVGGQVTIRTSTGIPREALVATLETLLRMNGATMVKEGGIYKVVPQAAVIRGNVTP